MPIEEIIKRIQERAKANGKDTKHQLQSLKEKPIQQDLYDPFEKEKNNCTECDGSGWIMEEREDSQPVFKMCKCQQIEKAKRLWKASGINPEQLKQTFSNYKPYNEITELAKDTAIDYYKNFESIKNTKQNSIAFIGQVGSGKTHLSIALAVNFLENKKIPVIYMPYRDVVTSIKQNMLDKEYYIKQLSKYQLAKILLIDDLFKGKVNESDKNIMFEIINYRYLNYLPIIVSSEFTADKLLYFDEGIGSRIIEMTKDYTVEITGKENNYRLRA
ncbi:ATP-binding protein [Clostridium caseinilyticum]|uniref:ATP-binding protein n=1 Tax=Clostridium caseinilyticum TaxID=3350403 RepID=UPI0038F6A80D